ncbi:MAG: 23S rRNA (uracil(1939)-C(5))-methyltransferase RlmD [Clostridia bacterium]
MKKGDILEVNIIDEGMQGEGIAKIDGYVMFVPFTLKDEVVRVEVTFVKKSFATAKVIKLLQASTNRIEHKCQHFRKCGGCDMQHINYQHQLEIKKNNIINNFKKIAGEAINLPNVAPSSKQYEYRNKAQFPLFTKDDKVCLGFYQENSHRFIEISKCALQGEWCDKFAQVFLQVANNLKLTTYDEIQNKGFLRHLILRNLNNHISVTIVVNAKNFNYTEEFVQAFLKLNTPFSLFISYNTKQTNLILYNAKCVYGAPNIKTEVLGIKTQVNPLSFMQINEEIRDAIYKKVKNILAQSKDSIVIDAYSGVGILSNILAPNATQVYCIEIVKEASQNANQLAIQNNNESKITNICGDSSAVIKELFARETLKNANVAVVLDPPRKGCEQEVIEQLNLHLPSQIIYISCNPSTLARDFSLLKQNYQIASINAYDMFPQTQHVETLCYLTLKN